MADASFEKDSDLLNAAAAYLAAARSTPGSLADEVKLAVERIAQEIKSLKEQIGGNDEFESRMASLEQSLQTIISNEAMIANALAKLGNQTTPFA